MTIITKHEHICDGCQNSSGDPKFIAAHYEIAKTIPEKPLLKFIRDYCERCAGQIVAALRDGAFKDKARKDLV